jgi:hypothetical protein
MVAIVPGSGEVIEAGYTINGKNELDFYKRMNVADNYNKALAEEKTLYNILKTRVQTYGEGSLNTTSMYPPKVIGGGSKPILPYGSPANPGIHPTLEEAQRAMSNHNLKEIAPGLYQEQSMQNGYVFVLSKAGKRSKIDRYSPPPKSSFTPTPFVPQPVIPPPNWGTVKYPRLPKEEKKKVAQDYDLLFNALEYTKTFEQEIDRLSMELVQAGDDLLTNYTYESIDFLPDVDIEVKTSNGEYKNAADVFEQTDQSQYLEAVVDESQASEDIQLANKLITYLESKISTSADFETLTQHYGSLEGTKFTGAMPTENKVDFYIELPNEYDSLDVEIRFDRL